MDNYVVHINPQDSINLSFEVFNNDNNKYNIFTTHVNTFKEDFKPSNRNIIEKRSGKSNQIVQIVGYKKYYKLDDNQNSVEVDLHEDNKLTKHSFYYLNANKTINIKMIAPKYTSFVFNDGSQTKEYNFPMKANENFEFSMYLKPDYSKDTYQRIYKFGHK